MRNRFIIKTYHQGKLVVSHKIVQIKLINTVNKGVARLLILLFIPV